MIGLFVKGLLIGLSIAAPVGAIGVLCIRRTLAEGRLVGFVSGLGAATADAMYGSIAAFGLTFISSFLVGQQVGLRLVGGMFLCYLGVRTFLAQPVAASPGDEHRRRGLLGAYLSTFLLTVTNPLTIISFAAVFAGLGIGSLVSGYVSAATLVVGVFVGSGVWWFILSGGVNLFRARFGTENMRWVNRISGGIISGFGVIALASLIGVGR